MATQTQSHSHFHGPNTKVTFRVRTVLRVTLGLIFFVMGLNGFFGFMAMPEWTGNAATYMSGLAATGYFFPVLKIVETLSGLTLLANRFHHIGLVALLPVTVNIFLFHAFLAPSGIAIGILVLALNITLIGMYIGVYKPLLKSIPQE